MYEELREQAEESHLDYEEDLEEEQGGVAVITAKVQSIFFSMTPTQRLIILALLLIVICLVSAFCLLASGKIAPPLS